MSTTQLGIKSQNIAIQISVMLYIKSYAFFWPAPTLHLNTYIKQLTLKQVDTAADYWYKDRRNRCKRRLNNLLKCKFGLYKVFVCLCTFPALAPGRARKLHRFLCRLKMKGFLAFEYERVNNDIGF
jgi:hypothetical protein